jgi:proteic killer suppression protein
MEVVFGDDDLDRLETDPRFTARLPAEVVKAYRKVLNYIRQAVDEREFRAWPGLHYEQLEDPTLRGQHSMRLNRQWRLLIELRGEGPNKVVVIRKIDSHYSD